MDTISQLDEKLHQCSSMPFLFVGSGVSRRYLNTPTWEALLTKYAILAKNDNRFAWKIYYDKHKDIESTRIADIYPLIASDIENDFNREWYTSERFAENRNNFSATDNNLNPFKEMISTDFKNISLDNATLPPNLSEELSILKKLEKTSLSGIITTNYDLLLESLFQSFEVFVGQDELFFSNPQGLCDIYKIHGSCNKPNSIIINKTDYEGFNKRNAYLASKLMTIFLEHPIIFLGYSINDDNIRNILDAIIDCLPQEKLHILTTRLIFVEYDDSALDPVIGEYGYASNLSNKTISMIKIKTKSYLPVFNSLLANESKIPIKLLKRIKSEVFELVKTTDTNGKLFVQESDLDRDLPIEVAIGFGVAQKLAQSGYSGIKAEQIYRDVACNDLNLVKEYVAKYTLTQLIPQCSSSIPIFKYTSGIPISELPQNVQTKLGNPFICSIKSPYSDFKESIPDILEKTSDNKAKEYRAITFYFYTKSNSRDELDWLEIYLKTQFENSPKILEKNSDGSNSTLITDLKRLIKLYDWLKYANN